MNDVQMLGQGFFGRIFLKASDSTRFAARSLKQI